MLPATGVDRELVAVSQSQPNHSVVETWLLHSADAMNGDAPDSVGKPTARGRGKQEFVIISTVKRQIQPV
jgi:hypothetical protein